MATTGKLHPLEQALISRQIAAREAKIIPISVQTAQSRDGMNNNFSALKGIKGRMPCV